MGSYPILMYHGIHDDPTDEGYDAVYSLSERNFKNQLDWLKRSGYKVSRLGQILNAPSQDKVVVISFDDGDITNYTKAMPLLLEREMVAEIFITTARIGMKSCLDKAAIIELYQAGQSIAAHGHTHRYLSDLEKTDVFAEISDSKHILENILGEKIQGMSLPGGRGGAAVLKLVKQVGYSYLCNSRIGHNHVQTNPFALKRVAITRNTTLSAFSQFVRGEGKYWMRLYGRDFILRITKQILGNKLYDKTRNVALRNGL